MARTKLSEKTVQATQRKSEIKRPIPTDKKVSAEGGGAQVEKKRKKRRQKNRWLLDLRKEQGVKSTRFAVPRAALVRIIREIGGDKRWTSEALCAIQTSAEKYLVDAYERANTYAVHSKRQMMTSRDVKQAVVDMRREDNRIASYSLN